MRPRRRGPWRLAVLALATPGVALAATAPAPAPAAAAPPSDDIVVEARQLGAVRDFVERLADAGRTGQLARWEDGVCAEVVGLEPDQARFVEGRIADAAKLARLPPVHSGCRPTALVVVSNDAAALAKGFAARYPNTLKVDGRSRLVHFVGSARPVRWISQSDVLPGDGGPLVKQPGQVDTGRLSNSRLVGPTRAVLSAMLVIVDGTQLGAVKLGPLGDYLAMVVLTQPRLDALPPSHSVMSLFEPDGEQDGLTDSDRSYLAALYKSPRDRDAAAQRGAIRNAMEKDGRAADKGTGAAPH